MRSVNLLMSRFRKEGQESQRLGQFFCNTFIKDPWPELYYEEDDIQSLKMIESWLSSHHYLDTLPVTVKES